LFSDYYSWLGGLGAWLGFRVRVRFGVGFSVVVGVSVSLYFISPKSPISV